MAVNKLPFEILTRIINYKKNMTAIWLMTNAIVGFCVAEAGSSVGAAVYEMVKNLSNYVWLKPEEGYFLDYPDDPEKETNLRTVTKRLTIIARKKHEGQHITENA